MKSELEQAISTLKFRDDKQDKYVFDITASRRIGGDIDTIDLVTKEKGVDLFKRTVEYATENEFDSIQLVLYKNKTAKEKIGTFTIPLQNSEPLSGTDNTPAIKQPSTNDADKFFQSFGGLSGFMAETRNQIGNQLDLQYARRDLGKAEAQVVSLESKCEQLASKNDELREQIKTLKDQIHDLERDGAYQKQTYEQKSNMLQLVTNGVVGFIGSQMGMTPEKLSGLLGIATDDKDTATASQPQPQPQHQDEKPACSDQKQQYIDAIVEYIYGLSDSEIKLFAGIAQYTSQSAKHLAKTYEHLRNQYKNAQNGSQEDNNDTD